MIDPARRPRLAPMARLRFDEATQTHLLLYPERGLKLNSTGTSIVQLCNGRMTFAEVVAALALTYDEPNADLAHEVATFLQALAARGLIEWVPP